jgi:hypothetical protein
VLVGVEHDAGMHGVYGGVEVPLQAEPILGRRVPPGLLIPAKEMSLRRPYGTPSQGGGISFPHAEQAVTKQEILEL